MSDTVETAARRTVVECGLQRGQILVELFDADGADAGAGET